MRGPWPHIVRIAPDSDPGCLAKEPFLTNGDQSFQGTFETGTGSIDEKVDPSSGFGARSFGSPASERNRPTDTCLP